VDNDRLVLAHARALLTSTPEGATAYVHADLREADKIMAEAATTLDFTEPIALILSGIEPGVVSCPRWRPDPTPSGPLAEVDAFGGVGRKP